MPGASLPGAGALLLLPSLLCSDSHPPDGRRLSCSFIFVNLVSLGKPLDGSKGCQCLSRHPQHSSRAGGAARSAPGVAAHYPHTKERQGQRSLEAEASWRVRLPGQAARAAAAQDCQPLANPG